jgi:hypothetical protein
MQATFKWVGNGEGNLKSFQFKKDAPKLEDDKSLVRIDMGLYGFRYIVMRGNLALTKSGEWVKLFRAHLVSFGPTIGLHDAEAARHRACADEWRGAFHEQNLERLFSRA